MKVKKVEKERLLVRDLRKFIDEDKNCPIALVSGFRRTGKTTMMHKLEEQYKNIPYKFFKGSNRR
jgi:predicted AAA+ superfamily ATPase